MSTIIIDKPKVDIDPSILRQLKTQTEEMGQVIIHFLYQSNPFTYSTIRIWPSTYLYDLTSSHKSELAHVENITMFPEWKEIPPGGHNYFSLFFTGLPKSCTKFDFVEECDGAPNNFEVRNIPRNDQDVYFIKIY
jgi:hypothetical protein